MAGSFRENEQTKSKQKEGTLALRDGHPWRPSYCAPLTDGPAEAQGGEALRGRLPVLLPPQVGHTDTWGLSFPSSQRIQLYLTISSESQAGPSAGRGEGPATWVGLTIDRMTRAGKKPMTT